MHYFESKLRDEIRFSTLLFPPVVFARSAACLIAQTYISSNPASGLFLMSPPISNASLPKELLPTDLAEFDFEPKFPVGIMGTPKEMEALRVHHRLGDDPNVDKMDVVNLDGSEALNEIERWLDDVGI
ncbi:hypothetical protein Hypma_015359 [Hypsizygus marmoreus]|uniref:Uncharacterized protein n=1 Tax=Hypsizygus marmoreus TaxID=39966 RepID=A0A369K837_HYPMA|nr:hypothetical protein Hypma_015359 [Hypsizygus marmoreus]